MSVHPGPIDRSRIRVKSFVVVPNPQRTHHAVWRGEDETQQSTDSTEALRAEGQPGAHRFFHRILGGSVEFGEHSVHAAVREMQEELGIELVEPRLLGVLENVYTFRGEPGHEILFIYTGSTTTDVVPPGGAEFFDLGRPMWVEWRRLDAVGETLPLYPAGLQDLLESRL